MVLFVFLSELHVWFSSTLHFVITTCCHHSLFLMCVCVRVCLCSSQCTPCFVVVKSTFSSSFTSMCPKHSSKRWLIRFRFCLLSCVFWSVYVVMGFELAWEVKWRGGQVSQWEYFFFYNKCSKVSSVSKAGLCRNVRMNSEDWNVDFGRKPSGWRLFL